MQESQMRCPHCQQEHPDDSLFCPVTGETISQQPLCPHCVREIDPGWEHCTHCGWDLTRVERREAPQRIPDKKKRKYPVPAWLIILLGVLCNLVLAAAIVVIFLVKNSGQNEPLPGTLAGGDSAPTWVGTGPEGGEILALASDPANPGTIYAGTTGHGVYKSQDGGATWTACGEGMELKYKSAISVDSLVVDRADTETIYAGGTGLFISRDGCRTWSVIPTGGLPDFAGFKLLGVGSNPTAIYINVYSSGMYQSTDGGLNWTALATTVAGTQIDLTYSTVQELVIDQQNPQELLAATWEGMIKSNDGGQTWHLLENGIPRITVYTLVVDPGNPNTYYAGTSQGLYKSTNAGETWVKINSDLQDNPFHLLAIDPVTPALLYAAVGSQGGLSYPRTIRIGLFISTDGGATWKESSLGLKRGGINALLIDAQSPARILAGTGEGIFASTDDGEIWVASSGGLKEFSMSALVIDPLSPSTLYAVAGSAGIFKSSDSGATWGTINTGLESPQVYTLAIDPLEPSTLYAGTDNGVFKSVDGGEKWEAASKGLVDKNQTYRPISLIAINPHTPSTLYSYNKFNDLFISIDSAQTWTVLPANLENISVNTIAIDPQGSDVLYIGTYGGVYKSTDGGGSWQPANSGLPESAIVKSLAIDPITPASLYAGLFANDIYKSVDGGGTWSRLDTDFSYARIDLFTAVQDGRTIVFALGNDYDDGDYYPDGSVGLYSSPDGGATWTEIELGLRGLHVFSLLVDPTSADSLYLGTTRGVYKSLPGSP